MLRFIDNHYKKVKAFSCYSVLFYSFIKVTRIAGIKPAKADYVSIVFNYKYFLKLIELARSIII